MSKEEYLSSFSDQALLQEIDILKDMTSMYNQGYSDTEVEAKYGFLYDDPESNLTALQTEAVNRALISKSYNKKSGIPILLAVAVAIAAYYLLKNK